MYSSSSKVRSNFFCCEVKTRERRARTSLQRTRNFSSNDKRDDNQDYLFTSSTLTARE